jgi:hypothetical protein
LTRGRLIDLGCQAADLHHRYHEIHSALFGAASFRLIVDALRGQRRRAYKECAQTLQGLREELAILEGHITGLAQADDAKGVDRETRQVLLEYTRSLSQTVAGLETIFAGLEQDESAYRDPGPESRSRFTEDKLQYDHLLSQLERLGTRLNRLFSNY